MSQPIASNAQFNFVHTFHYCSGIVHACVVVTTLIGSLTLVSQASGQASDRSVQTPFVGFQSFDGTRQPINAGAATASRTTSPVARQRYSYPAGGTSGYLNRGSNANYQSRTQPRLETSASSQMSRVNTSTGALNHSGRSTLPLTAQDSRPNNGNIAAWSRPITGVGPRVAPASTRSSSGWTESSLRTAQATLGAPISTPPQINRQSVPQNTNRPRLNQAVVQQTSSTMSSARTSVARATTPDSATTTVARPPQNCVCVPNNYAQNPTYLNPNVAYQPVYAQAANQVPSLQGNGGTPNFNLQPSYQFQPGLGVPRLGGNQNVLTPFFRGSGVYTPLLPLFQMPQGTYLGQGIIGQPTAYVDGQPIRNLLRYISP